MLNIPVVKSSKCVFLGLFAVIAMGIILLPTGSNCIAEASDTQGDSGEYCETNTIVPGVRVGDYTFGMSKDAVLESLGEPRMIFYGEERYSLDNLPRTYFMVYDDISFSILDDSVKGITAISPYYKLDNGLRVGDPEQEVKKALGNDFHFKESPWKDFLTYGDKGIGFEIDKNDRTIMEINVFPVENLRTNNKGHIPPTSTINERGSIVDKIDYPFVNDQQVIGTWKAVDFIGEMEQFKPSRRNWKHGELYLKELVILPNGKTSKPWWTWTKGLIFHWGDRTASKYTLKDIEGSTYMFFEWKSGDYTIRHRKPSYYVLKKISSESGAFDEAGFVRREVELAKQEAELYKAKAELYKAQAEIEKYKAEIAWARAEIEKAKSEAEKAKAEIKRIKSEANCQASEVEQSKKKSEKNLKKVTSDSG